MNPLTTKDRARGPDMEYSIDCPFTLYQGLFEKVTETWTESSAREKAKSYTNHKDEKRRFIPFNLFYKGECIDSWQEFKKE